jgi:hypothetical protein
MSNAADVFATVTTTQAALEAITDETPAEEQARVEAAYKAAIAAMFDLL